jgi:hypothetical protein
VYYLLEEDAASATANVGFAQEGADGEVRPRFVKLGLRPWPNVQHRVERFCAHPDPEGWEASAEEAIQRTLPPCASGSWEVPVSAPVYVGERDVTLKVPTLADSPAPATSAGNGPSPAPPRPKPPPSPRDVLNGACLESYARERPGDNMSRWCGCVATNLAGVLSTDERQQFVENAVSFIAGGLDGLLPNGQRNWRLYTPIAACQR